MLSFCVFIYPEPRSACLELRTAAPDSLLGRVFYFQQLTNCPRFDTLLRALCFQQLPTVKFRKPFVLITIQIAGVYPHQQRHCLEKKEAGRETRLLEKARCTPSTMCDVRSGLEPPADAAGDAQVVLRHAADTGFGELGQEVVDRSEAKREMPA